MAPPKPVRPWKGRASPAVKAAVVYAVLAALWILLSDWIVALLVAKPVAGAWGWLQTLKGFLFVSVTAVLLWVVLDRHWRGLAETQTRLRHAQRLEAVGRLAGGLAHDFNNLLTGVAGYSDLLLGRDDLDAAARRDIEEIRKAAGKAGALTGQLLAFSRQQPLRTRVLDLNEVISELDGVLRRLIRENIEVVLEPGPDLRNVEADPGQLEQVLMNLVLNASDAMPDGGRLTIETRNAEIDQADAARYESATAGPHVLLAVSDTGVGMDDETAAQVFEPFFTTKRRGEGTGLGLATVYGIVKQHGGMIWVYTEPGEGSTFKLYLPAVEGPSERFQRAAVGDVEAGGSGRILLVEDDDEVRAVAERILRRLGYDVITAEHPSRALEFFSAQGDSVDLLLTDVVMPEQSGVELAERLRETRPGLPVAFMSGYTEESSAGTRMPREEVFIAKPFTPRELGAKVREALERDR